MLCEASWALSWRILALCWLILAIVGASWRQAGEQKGQYGDQERQDEPRRAQDSELDSNKGPKSDWDMVELLAGGTTRARPGDPLETLS